MPLNSAPRLRGLKAWRPVLAWMLAALCLIGATPAVAQQVGEVVYAQGLTSVQRPGEDPRFVQKGDVLNVGDVISTSNRGYAVVSFRDGTKITLRPGTTFAIDKFNHDAGEEAALFRLLKGGVRALTGLISKRDPQGMQFTSRTSTMGIRGTSFDARQCEGDCAEEVKPGRGKPVPPPPQVVARVAVLSGSASVIGVNGQTRAAARGTPLYSGETVRTQKASYAVLGFRDQSKVTVIADSEFKLENVRFTGAKSDSGNLVVRVLRGGARALTGLLAKSEPQNVQVNMVTAVVGIRGTGVDAMFGLDCIAPDQCAEGAFVHTWEGTVALEVDARSLLIALGQTGVFNPTFDRLTLVEQRPQFMIDEPAPRPDTVEIDFANLFAAVTLDRYRAGLYVAVREGHIEFLGSLGSIDLGGGEAGYLGDGMTVPVRLADQPPFLVNDPYPLPEQFDEKVIRLLEVLNPGGGAGDVICEVQ
jgi:hypothetical protein